MEIIINNSTELIINVGSLLSSVPHTRPTRVTASMMSDDNKYLKKLNYPKPNYEGPAGITSVLSDYCFKENIPSISIWGHAPHYLQIPHNPTLTLNILKEISKIIDIEIDYSDIQKDSQNFNDNLKNALSDQNDIQKYVEKLEERYDSEEEVKYYTEAINYLEKESESSQFNSFKKSQIGDIFFQLGDLEKALKYYNKSLELEDNKIFRAEILFKTAETEIILKNYDSAINHYVEIKNDFPNSPYSLDSDKRIAEIKILSDK